MIRVQLDDADLVIVRYIASERFSAYVGRSSHYPDSRRGNLIGAAGEVALYRWATSHGWGCAWLGKRHADLRIDELRVEVKTWSTEWWGPLGRCVRPEQYAAIARKADVVVWARADLPEHYVDLMGWNTPREVARAPQTTTRVPSTGEPLRQLQLPPDELHAMSDIGTVLAGAPQLPPDGS